jgi:flagellar assembly protein FliH
LSETAQVLDAGRYAIGKQPYLVQQVAAAALAELKRKRDAGSKPPVAPARDPEAERLREEASQIKAQAERLLKAAEERAQAIATEAEAQAAQMKERAKEEGYQEGFSRGSEDGYEAGFKKGEEEGLARYSETVARLQALLESAQTEKEAYFSDREALLVELVARVSAKVLVREIESRPDHILHLLRQAIRRLAERSKLLVYLHPSDLEKVTNARADGLLNLAGVKQVEFLADDGMVQGGVRIRSGNQTLDATLDAQLAEIVRGLLEEAYHET